MVSADLRARVDSAVRELPYYPDQLASAIASSRTGRVGVVVPSLTNGVFGDYLRALRDVFIPAGIQVLVLNSHYLAGVKKRQLPPCGRFPEAIILAGISQTRQARKSLKQSGIPVIQTMELTASPININVGMSQREAGYIATRHLFELGHIQVGQISAQNNSRSLKRIEGYKQAVEEFGAVPMIVSIDKPDSVHSVDCC